MLKWKGLILNKSNVELYINGVKYKYKKYFQNIKKWAYLIELKIKTNINDCSFMFSNCYKIIK